MNSKIKIISKTLMTKISHVSWGGVKTKGVTTKAFTVFRSHVMNYYIISIEISGFKYTIIKQNNFVKIRKNQFKFL